LVERNVRVKAHAERFVADVLQEWDGFTERIRGEQLQIQRLSIGATFKLTSFGEVMVTVKQPTCYCRGIHVAISICVAEDEREEMDYIMRKACIEKQDSSFRDAFQSSPFSVRSVIVRLGEYPCLAFNPSVIFNPEDFQAR
jgi:hypothetical protein